MSIKKLEEIREIFKDRINLDMLNIGIFMGYVISLLKDQSDQIADLRQELAEKEDAINIGDIIKEARLRNG